MTLTTLPPHLMPMVEKAAKNVFVTPNMPRLEDFLIIFLNACLDGGVARQAGFVPRHGVWNAHEGNHVEGTPQCLIFNFGEVK